MELLRCFQITLTHWIKEFPSLYIKIQWISLGTAFILAYSLFSACSLQHTGYSCITLELSAAVQLRSTAKLSQTTKNRQVIVYFVWQTNNGHNGPPYSLLLTWAGMVSAEGTDICLPFAFCPVNLIDVMHPSLSFCCWKILQEYVKADVLSVNQSRFLCITSLTMSCLPSLQTCSVGNAGTGKLKFNYSLDLLGWNSG